MNTTRTNACIAMTMLVTLLGCSEPVPATEQGSTTPPRETSTFVNRVWRVSESSSVARGHLYVLLSEGTLVVTRPNDKPSLGTWTNDGRVLTMVEEGIPRKVDVLELSRTGFRIRINGRGEPVDITLVPAEESPRPNGL